MLSQFSSVQLRTYNLLSSDQSCSTTAEIGSQFTSQGTSHGMTLRHLYIGPQALSLVHSGMFVSVNPGLSLL